MTRIESDIVTIPKTNKEVFDFLSSFNNIKTLMPDQVTDWTGTENECTFTIKGMASLGMAYESKTPDSEIKIKRNGKAPFDFMLICKMNEGASANETKLQLMFDADLNPFLKMMAEKPLKNFLNLLVNKYQSLMAA